MTAKEKNFYCKLEDQLHERTNALINYQTEYNYIKALAGYHDRGDLTDEGFIKYIKRSLSEFEADDKEYTIKWEVL